MTKKIIFFITSPFSKRNFYRFGVDILISNGFCVEIWDFTPFLDLSLYRNYILPDLYSYGDLRIFQSLKDATSSIGKLNYDDTLVISLLGFTAKTLPIYRFLSLNKIGYGFVISAGLPSIPLNEGKRLLLAAMIPKLSKLLSRFIRQPSQSIGLILIKLLPFQVLGIRPAKFAFIPGLESSLPKLVSRKTDIIHSCSFDFNLYLDSIDSGKLDNGLNADKEQFIVFLDEFLPFHPDYLSANVASPCAPELYYPALVSFFEAIESKLGCEVVVAAHPRSSYEHRPDYFGGRKIFFGKTHQLVKQSKGVITHGSTSVSFAVIYKKPIFFTSLEVIRQYRGYPLHAFYESMAQSLGKKLIILDQPLDVDWQSEIIVDLDAYGRYLDLYVKSPLAPERNSWQIFADYVLENL